VAEDRAVVQEQRVRRGAEALDGEPLVGRRRRRWELGAELGDELVRDRVDARRDRRADRGVDPDRVVAREAELDAGGGGSGRVAIENRRSARSWRRRRSMCSITGAR
jgi:hypothetical protein